ncbi:hypothetical protein TNCV_4171501 [Trichonephila clavipes]|nr:hypothetical protein TNCV_4171501 [Trichonephila clavipes]
MSFKHCERHHGTKGCGMEIESSYQGVKSSIKTCHVTATSDHWLPRRTRDFVTRTIVRVRRYLNHCSRKEAYSGNALSQAQCSRWFEKFQNGDFDVRNEERGRRAKKFEDADLQALFDEDDGQTQEHLAE